MTTRPPTSLSAPTVAATALVALAAAAGATATWVRERARAAEREHPPAGRFIHIDGVRLHYLLRGHTEGHAPPVLLLHGNSVTVQDFEACGLLARLAQRHTVLAFDRPGFGHSLRPRGRDWSPAAQAELLLRASNALGLHRPVVLGHSLGALVALAMGLAHPGSVAALVLLGGYYYPERRLDAMLMSPVATPVLGDVLRHTVTAVSARLMLDRVARAIFSPQAVPPQFFPVLSRELLLRPSQLRANAEDAAAMRAQAQALCERYGGLRLPVTLMAGAQDAIVDREAHSVRLHRELPHSELLVVPGAGHMLHYAAPDAVAQAVERAGG